MSFRNYGMVKSYAALVGVILVATGLLGFISNPLVGEQTATQTPLFVTGTMHDVVHLATGLLALYIAFMVPAAKQAAWVIGFGVLYLVVLVLTLISGDLFGVLSMFGKTGNSYGVSGGDDLLHAALGVVSIGVGYMAGGASARMAKR